MTRLRDLDTAWFEREGSANAELLVRDYLALLEHAVTALREIEAAGFAPDAIRKAWRALDAEIGGGDGR